MTMFRSESAFARTLPIAPPGTDGFTLDALTTAWNTLRPGLVNSLLTAIPATIVSALLGSMTAYGLTTITWRGRSAWSGLIIAGIFIPYQAVLVPLTQFWSHVPGSQRLLTDRLSFVWALGVPNDYVGIVELVVTHVAYGIPICTLLFRTYYKTMSEEMIESARLDGASASASTGASSSRFRGRCSRSSLIYQFTQIYNDLLFTLVLVSTGFAVATRVSRCSLVGRPVVSPRWQGPSSQHFRRCSATSVRRRPERRRGRHNHVPTHNGTH